MGFADLSIEQIAAQYNLPVEQIFALGERLEIAYKNQYTCLALEDAKAVILSPLHRRQTNGAYKLLRRPQKTAPPLPAVTGVPQSILSAQSNPDGSR